MTLPAADVYWRCRGLLSEVLDLLSNQAMVNTCEIARYLEQLENDLKLLKRLDQE